MKIKSIRITKVEGDVEVLENLPIGVITQLAEQLLSPVLELLDDAE